MTRGTDSLRLDQTLLKHVLQRADVLGARVATMSDGGDPDQDLDTRARIRIASYDLRDGRWKVAVERKPMRSEGSAIVKIVLADVAPDGALPARASRALDALLEETARLQRRDAAVLKTPGSAYPAWSFTMHRVAKRLLLHHGLDPARTVEVTPFPTPEMTNHLASWSLARDKDWIRGGVPRAFGQRDQAGDLDFVLHRDRVRAVRIGDKSRLHVVEKRTSFHLGIPGIRFPETMLAVIPGMDLRDVVDHPAFDAIDVKVRDVQQRDGEWTGLVLRLDEVRDPVIAPPDGVDMSWAI